MIAHDNGILEFVADKPDNVSLTTEFIYTLAYDSPAIYYEVGHFNTYNDANSFLESHIVCPTIIKRPNPRFFCGIKKNPVSKFIINKSQLKPKQIDPNAATGDPVAAILTANLSPGFK